MELIKIEPRRGSAETDGLTIKFKANIEDIPLEIEVYRDIELKREKIVEILNKKKHLFGIKADKNLWTNLKKKDIEKFYAEIIMIVKRKEISVGKAYIKRES